MAALPHAAAQQHTGALEALKPTWPPAMLAPLLQARDGDAHRWFARQQKPSGAGLLEGRGRLLLVALAVATGLRMQ